MGPLLSLVQRNIAYAAHHFIGRAAQDQRAQGFGVPARRGGRFDRYGVMFFFLGSWWQVFLITALRARRTADNGGSLLFSVWVPYLVLGAFISALILWVAPFNLMWVSIFWFVASFGLFAAIRVSADKICKVFMILAIVVLVGENILFVILDAIV